ncbi:hypothetical protein [Nocardioides sp. SYSU DS0651]
MNDRLHTDSSVEETPKSSRLPFVIGFLVLLGIVLLTMLVIGGAVL